MKKKHDLEGVDVEVVFLISIYDLNNARLLSTKVRSSSPPLEPAIKQKTWRYPYQVSVSMAGRFVVSQKEKEREVLGAHTGGAYSTVRI